MKNLENITTVFSVMKGLNVSIEDLITYANNQSISQVSSEPELSSVKKLPLEVLYENNYRSFFFEAGKKPVAIICDNIGVAFEDAPRYMNWHDANKFCKKYFVGGLKWSLPNKESGHLKALYENKEAINVVLAAFGKEPLKEAWYWSSSEYSYGNAWKLTLSDGYVNDYSTGSNYYYVRLVLLF